jgi:hypothetical protein
VAGALPADPNAAGSRALRSPPEELNEVLSAIVTVRTLFETLAVVSAVRAIGDPAKKPSLRSLAFNQVGYFSPAQHSVDFAKEVDEEKNAGKER